MRHPINSLFGNILNLFLLNRLLSIKNPEKPNLEEILYVLHEHGYKILKIACEMTQNIYEFYTQHLPVGVTAKLIRCSCGIPCLHAPEVHSRSNSCGGLGQACY